VFRTVLLNDLTKLFIHVGLFGTSMHNLSTVFCVFLLFNDESALVFVFIAVIIIVL